MDSHFPLEHNQLFVLIESAGGVYQAEQLTSIVELLGEVTPFFKLTADERIGFIVESEKLESVSLKLQEKGFLVRSFQNAASPSPKTCLGSACPHHTQDAFSDALEISSYFESHPHLAKETQLRIGLNGCDRGCTQSATDDFHLVAEPTGYKISIGGKSKEIPQLSMFLAENISSKQLPSVLHILIDVYLRERNESEPLHEVIERIGLGSFLEALDGMTPKAESTEVTNFDSDTLSNESHDTDEMELMASSELLDTTDLVESDLTEGEISSEDLSSESFSQLNEVAEDHDTQANVDFEDVLPDVVEVGQESDLMDMEELEIPVFSDEIEDTPLLSSPEKTNGTTASHSNLIQTDEFESTDFDTSGPVPSSSSENLMDDEMMIQVQEATKDDLDVIKLAMRSENSDEDVPDESQLPLESNESTIHHTPKSGVLLPSQDLTTHKPSPNQKKPEDISALKAAVIPFSGTKVSTISPQTSTPQLAPAEKWEKGSGQAQAQPTDPFAPFKIAHLGNRWELNIPGGIQLGIDPHTLPETKIPFQFPGGNLELERQGDQLLIHWQGIEIKMDIHKSLKAG